MDAWSSQSSKHGRRRRLLVSQESQELVAEFEALAPQTTAAVIPNNTVTTSERPVICRMVSGQLWKHILLLLAVVLVSMAAVWSEIERPEALEGLSGPNQPRIGRGLAGTFLVLAGQLSLVIGWIRSRSSVDFSGRYRCWKWLAGALITIGILWITNCQDALPHLAQGFVKPLIGGVSAARRTLVIVPITGVSIWILSRVIPDLGRNRYSQTLFVSGVITAAGRLLLSYGASPWSCPVYVMDSILLVSTGLLVCSLLLHTRFVLYISNDPPECSPAATASVEQYTSDEVASVPSSQPDAGIDDPVSDSNASDLALIGVTEPVKTPSAKKSVQKSRRGKRRARKAA
ncbi:MAG: hypothetical protein MK110_14495 [Fuerstiella sp.]|nr:hypothetical protein [Fuerstiella sp.]